MGILQPLWNLTASLAFGRDEAAHEQTQAQGQSGAATTTTSTLLGAQNASRPGIEASVHAPNSGRSSQSSSSLSVEQTTRKREQGSTRSATGEPSHGHRSSSRKTRHRSASHGRLRRPSGTVTRARSSTEPHLHTCMGKLLQIAPTSTAAAAATAPTTPSSAGRSSRVHDERYKTELCRNFEELGSCPYRDCLYAHGLEELRPAKLHPKHKTKLCKPYEESGKCNFGRRCRFIHRGENEASATAMLLANGRSANDRSGAGVAPTCASQNGSLAMPASPGPFTVPALSLHCNPSLGREPLLCRLGRPTAVNASATATTPAPPASSPLGNNSFRDLDSCWWSRLGEPLSAASTSSSTWSDLPASQRRLPAMASPDPCTPSSSPSSASMFVNTPTSSVLNSPTSSSSLDVQQLSNALLDIEQERDMQSSRQSAVENHAAHLAFRAEPDQDADKRTPKATTLPPAEPDPKHCNVL